VDHVVHAIGQSLPAESNADPVRDAATSLGSILRTLEALRHRPTTRLTYVSSGGTIYGNVERLPIDERAECRPISSYGVMKLAAEKYLGMYHALYGISSLSLRVANAYGPGQPVRASQGFLAACLDAARRRQPVRLYGGGRNIRDFVYIDDVVAAVVRLAEQTATPPVVNVGSGLGVSLVDTLSLVERVTGRPLAVEHVEGRSVDVSAIVLSTELLSSLVDWRPLPLEDGIGRAWAALEGRSGDGRASA
jgi:UDP-glucose 4-epimerase